MTEYLIAEFLGFIKKYKLIEPKDSILIAVSGGKDSTVLTDVLFKIRQTYALQLAIAHLNHQLRGTESDEDAQHCKKMADNYGVSYYYQEIDVRSFAKKQRQSIEQAAHTLRYKFLVDTADKYGFKKITTAHTKNDQAETVLMNLLKGGMWESLQGIPIYQNNIIRPLLWCSREKIMKYLTMNGLIWREDSSNADLSYRRNRVRHELLPLLQNNYNPQIINTLNLYGNYFGEIRDLTETISQNYYSKVVIDKTDEKIILDRNLLKSLPRPIQKKIVRTACNHLFSARNPISSHLEIKIIEELERIQSGKRLTFGQKGEILYDRGNLVIRKVNNHRFIYTIQINENYCWHEEKLEFISRILNEENNSETWDEVIDYKVFEGKQILLRSWQEGDTFIPFGQSTGCKISDFFINKKISRYNKYKIPLLVAGDEIIWVCGYRISEKARVTDNTRQRVGISCRYAL